ncbi:unnamed protein product [Blepharisma stoltei]|uniref:Uncharacterized protein n=1 Tax=Blepharisma stoltei TaxID=1481888 RepID=A0AAU9IUA3_9CILI|nr:unnamed protein product [Blepharisma stoltei]
MTFITKKRLGLKNIGYNFDEVPDEETLLEWNRTDLNFKEMKREKINIRKTNYSGLFGRAFLDEAKCVRNASVGT